MIIFPVCFPNVMMVLPFQRYVVFTLKCDEECHACIQCCTACNGRYRFRSRDLQDLSLHCLRTVV